MLDPRTVTSQRRHRILTLHAVLLVGLVTVTALASTAKADPVIGMFDPEANPRRADFLSYNRFRQDLLKHGLG